MYQILKDGVPLVTATDIKWVRKQRNGYYAPCSEKEAQGVVIGETLYSVLGRPEIEDTEAVVVTEVDETEYQIHQKVLQDSIEYVATQTLYGNTITEDDQKIRASALYPDWEPGNHTVGEMYNAAEQTWECYQAYDNDIYPDIAPGNPAWYTFNRPLHGKSKETARPFVPVQGAHDMYRNGEYMIWTDGKIYKCVDPNGTAYSPADYAAAWEVQE